MVLLSVHHHPKTMEQTPYNLKNLIAKMISYSVCVPLCLLGKSFTLYKKLSFDFMFMKTKTIPNGYLYRVKTNLEACYFTQLHAHYTLIPTCCQKEQIKNFRTVSFPQRSILPKAGVGSKLGSTLTITLEKSITESSGQWTHHC